MAAIAEDWQEELAPYPSWAISNAARWWMSADNPDRRRKPLPGDIAERAKRERGIAKLAVSRAKRFAPIEASTPEVDDKPITEEQRAEMNAILHGFGIGGDK